MRQVGILILDSNTYEVSRQVTLLFFESKFSDYAYNLFCHINNRLALTGHYL